jgi:hypothetical protein
LCYISAMPPIGRPPVAGTTRGDRVCVRYTDAEIDAIDNARGGLSRSDFVRQAVAEKAARS